MSDGPDLNQGGCAATGSMIGGVVMLLLGLALMFGGVTAIFGFPMMGYGFYLLVGGGGSIANKGSQTFTGQSLEDHGDRLARGASTVGVEAQTVYEAQRVRARARQEIDRLNRSLQAGSIGGQEYDIRRRSVEAKRDVELAAISQGRGIKLDRVEKRYPDRRKATVTLQQTSAGEVLCPHCGRPNASNLTTCEWCWGPVPSGAAKRPPSGSGAAKTDPRATRFEECYASSHGAYYHRTRDCDITAFPSARGAQEDKGKKPCPKCYGPSASSVSASDCVVTPGGRKYHRLGCAAVGTRYEVISIDQAVQHGYTPCAMCVSTASALVKPHPSPPKSPKPYWRCPRCGREMQKEAIMCGHCGVDSPKSGWLRIT